MNPHSLAAWSAAFFLSSVLFSHTVALRLLLLIIGVAFSLWAIAQNRRTIRVLPPLWLAFALWGAWAALSITWSVEPERSVKEWHNEIAYAAVAFWFCFVAAQASRAPRIILPVFAVACVAICVVALYHFPQGIEPYAAGWHGGSGNHSSALLTLMPCTLMAAWYARRAGWPRPLHAGCLVLAALLAVSAYTTLNRTVWLGFALQLILMGILLLRHSRVVLTRRIKATAVAAVLAVVAAGTLITLGVQAEREATGGARPFLHDPRFALWPEIAERIHQRPLAGYGFGRGVLRVSLRTELGETNLWHSHNLLLDSVLQTGFPGLLLLLVLLGAALRQGWRLVGNHSDAAAACGIAIIAVVAGMLMRNMTDVLWVRQNALLYWGVLGVLLAWGTVYGASPQR
jgi:O-antigen ligase